MCQLNQGKKEKKEDSGVSVVQGQRYRGEVGEVVLGCVTDVQQKRYVVDVKSATQAVLLLSAVNLPGGVLRRRTELDALEMREHLREGDVVVCEVR